MQVFAGSESLPVKVLLIKTFDFYYFSGFEGLGGQWEPREGGMW